MNRAEDGRHTKAPVVIRGLRGN